MSEEASVAGFAVGAKARFTHLLTAEDIRRFVELTGDDNPLHVERAYAEQTSFKGIVAHGMLSAAFISTLVGKQIPGRGALWLAQNLEFLLPVRVGDELHIEAEVTAVQVSQRILTLRTVIFNQHRQPVLRGEGRVKALEAAASPAATAERESPRVAIVTGASRGIGAATARKLAAAGYAVVVNYRRDAESAARLVDEIAAAKGQAVAAPGDVSRPGEARALVALAVARFGGLSSLVNNASARNVVKPFAALTAADLAGPIETQYYGAFHLIQEALPWLLQATNAAVVNVGSVAADGAPPAQMAPYLAAKAALGSLTKSLAVEYGPRGVRFNLVAPGMTDTGMIADLPEKARMLTRMQTPLRRLATAEDIAESIAFLLGPEARHLTGETLRICGGAAMI